MATHVRGQIRAAAVSLLTGLPTTGNNVYSGRSRALAKDHAPALLVYCARETSAVDSQGSPATLYRELMLIVEGRASVSGADASAMIEVTLDRIAQEVEVALLTSPPLAGLAIAIDLIATTINVESPGESHAGEVRMEFRAVYRTKENAPTAAV